MMKFLITLSLATSAIIFAFIYNAPAKTVSESIQAAIIGIEPSEYGYELTLIKNKDNKPINKYLKDPKKPASLGVIEKIKKDYPNLKQLGISITWYANTIQAGKIIIKPKVKKKHGPEWKVASYTRKTAEKVTYARGGPIWEGTPTDRSVIELCKLLHESGFKVTIYPYLLVDQKSQPWRGDIKAKSDKDVAHFFEEYNKYILHYASLEHEGVRLRDVIHGFFIGSEFEELTKYRNSKTKEFPFVNGLVDLAAKARAALGPKIKISYAANWSEYHSTPEHWYHLDKLWQDKNIDYVGIDAYFPLIPPNTKSASLTPSDIAKGWESGEYYDYDSTTKKLEPAQAIKNIRYWWTNYHINPDGTVTGWTPKMKPIVFAEIGFTALDHTTTDPFSYIDTSKKGRGLPRKSNGRINQKFQYEGYLGTINFIKKINHEPANKKIIAGAYWYNIDPKGRTEEWIHNHELKIAEFERGEFTQKGRWKGVINKPKK